MMAEDVTELDMDCHVPDLSEWKDELMKLMENKFNESKKKSIRTKK